MIFFRRMDIPFPRIEQLTAQSTLLGKADKDGLHLANKLRARRIIDRTGVAHIAEAPLGEPARLSVRGPGGLAL
jgi:hypothetical protein